MSFKIVVDSCCDFSKEEQKDPHYIWVPLTLTVGDLNFTDDLTFDQSKLLLAMKKSSVAAKSACPSPFAFAKSYDCGADDIYVVTLSAMLSGTHNSAMQGRSMFLESHPGIKINIHVFNSCSACTGEALIAMKIKELALSGETFPEIVQQTEKYISEMRTLFVLDNLDNLRKSGRLSKVQAILTSSMRIKLLMSSTPEGEIKKIGQGLSARQCIRKMVEKIKSDSTHRGKIAGITEIDCMTKAAYFRSMLIRECEFKDIFISSGHGVSTIYADDGGLVIAY